MGFKLYGVDRVILTLFIVCVTVGVVLAAADMRESSYYTYETTATMVGYASDGKTPVWSYNVNGETIVNYPGASGRRGERRNDLFCINFRSYGNNSNHHRSDHFTHSEKTRKKMYRNSKGKSRCYEQIPSSVPT